MKIVSTSILSLFCLFQFLLVSSINAQQVLRGVVQNMQGKKIEAASVSIIDSTSKLGFAFTSTGIDGGFSISYTDNEALKRKMLKVVAWGYLTKFIPIDSTGKFYTVLLEAGESILPGVTVKNNTPLVKKGDTLVFSSDRFAEKTDRVIGDVLKRIPGISIDENGAIRFNNKPINYFYIDGDNLLDGNYNIATNNIPATVVDKIQVIENNQHIKLLNGVIPSESPAINITIKEEAKTTFINTASLATGTPSLYQGDFSNMAFKSRFKAINSLKANNVSVGLGEETRSLTLQTNNNSLLENQLLFNSIGYIPNIQRKRTILNNSTLVNTNLLFKLASDIGLRINAAWVNERENQSYNFKSNYYLPNDTIVYDESSMQTNRNKILQTEFTTDVNSQKRYLRNTLNFWSHTQDQQSDLISSANNINQLLFHRLSSVSNYFQSIVPLKNNYILSLFSNNYLSSTPEKLVVIPGLFENLLNSGNAYLKTTQQTTNKSFLTHQYITLNHLKTTTSIQYAAGFQFQQNNLQSHLFITDLNELQKQLADSFTNHFTWKKTEVYVKASYRYEYKRNRLSLTIPVRFVSMHLSDPVLSRKDGLSKYFITPEIMWNHKLQKEHSITIQASNDVKFSDFRELYGGIIMNNYRSFQSNNIPPQMVKSYSVNTTLEFKRTIKLLNIRIGYYASLQKAKFAYAYLLNNNIIQKQLVEAQNDIKFNTASFYLSKYLFPIRTSFSFTLNHSFSNFQQLQNGSFFPVKQRSNNLFVGLGKKTGSWGSFKYELFYNRNKTNIKLAGIETSQTNISTRQSLSLDIYVSEKLSSKFTHSSYYNHQAFLSPNSFQISDILFRYLISRKISAIEFSVQNIFNAQSYISSSTSANQFSQYNFNIRSRMILIKLLFDLQQR